MTYFQDPNHSIVITSRTTEDGITWEPWTDGESIGFRAIEVETGRVAETPHEKAVLLEVFNLDEAWLVTEDGSWVFIVMGEDPEDMPADYSMSLDDILKEI